MDPMSWVAALGGFGANVGSSILSFNGAKQANEQNLASAREMMAFQERMSRNRYQYQMDDMRKAGLNPILAAGATPPSGPSGASATSQQNPYGNLSKIDLAQSLANIELMKANTAKALNESKVAGAQADLVNVNTANAALASQRASNDLAESTANTEFVKNHPKIASALNLIGRISNAVHGSSSAVHGLYNTANAARNYKYGVIR